MQTQPSEFDALIAKLQSVPMLRGLARAGLEQLAQRAIRRTYAPGAVIFLEGDTAAALYDVESGWVKIVKMAVDDREQLFYFWGPGELFGGIFVKRPASATAIALEATTLWLLPRTAIRQMVTTNFVLALPVIELVADLSLHTVTTRLARLLLEQAESGVVQRQRWAIRMVRPSTLRGQPVRPDLFRAYLAELFYPYRSWTYETPLW